MYTWEVHVLEMYARKVGLACECVMIHGNFDFENSFVVCEIFGGAECPSARSALSAQNADVDYKCNLLIAPGHPAAYSVTGVLSSL